MNNAKASSLLATLAAACTLALSACSAAQQSDARADIEQANRSFSEAVQRGDAAAIANLYTENGSAMPPGGETVSGRPALQEMWKGALAAGVKGLRLTTGEVDTHSDTAIETGTFEALAADGSSAQQGKYIVIWKREGGAWKLHRDIWNSNSAPPPPAPPAAPANTAAPETAPAPPSAN